MTDFHCHILPEMDDGSKSTEMSQQMLDAEKMQGVSRIVFTPHFYATKEDAESFLDRRLYSYFKLISACGEKFDFRLGAEVYYYPGVSHSEYLDSLCIKGTKTVLIEMPFEKWSATQVSEIFAIADRGLTPVLAHFERYLNRHNLGMLESMLDGRIFVQSNAEFFTDKKTRKTAYKMLDKKQIHLLGSDAHNMTTRAPGIGDALGLLDREDIKRFDHYSDMLLAAR